MNDPNTIGYHIAVQPPGGENIAELLIDWGNSPNWATRYKKELDGARQIALLPKQTGTGLLPVIMQLEPELDWRWIIFSRVFIQMNPSARVRIYALGRQRTVDGKNQKQMFWIYPNGVVEIAPEPTKAFLYMKPASTPQNGTA